jgi:hypothetical protein
MAVIWGNRKAIYFFCEDWTGQIGLKLLMKSAFVRSDLKAGHKAGHDAPAGEESRRSLGDEIAPRRSTCRKATFDSR